MKKVLILFSIICIIFGFSGLSLANAESEMNLNVISLDGYTNYKIYDNSLTWKSLLEFPLDTKLLSLEYKYLSDIDILFSNTNKKMPFYFNYQINIKDENDKKFKDSDWLSANFNEDPIIYAEAKSKLDVSIIELNTIFYNNSFDEDSSMNLGLGYENKKYDFVAYDAFIDDNYNNVTSYIEGNVIKYNVEYKIPYVLANYKNEYKSINYNFGLKYSPLVTAKDWDYHILRDKTSESETDGTMFSYNIGITNQIKTNWLFRFDYENTSIDTIGTQTQIFSDGTEITDITSEIFMDSSEFTFSLVHLF